MKTKTPPKDSGIYLLNVGYPWLVMGTWSEVADCWVYPNLQVDLYEGKWNDVYWETNQAQDDEIIDWAPMPKAIKGDK